MSRTRFASNCMSTLIGFRRRSRPTFRPSGFRKDWRVCHAEPGALFCGCGFPVAKCQAANDQPIDVYGWSRVRVPNSLYQRIAPSSHGVHGIILAGNVYDDSTGAFAAQLALSLIGAPSRKEEKSSAGRGYPQYEKHKSQDDPLHGYALRPELQPGAAHLANFLTGEIRRGTTQ
jgi:hypothetical protein